MKSIRKLITPATLLALGLAILVGAFQNCARDVRHGSAQGITAYSNGTPYEGKVYASQETCVRDGVTRPVARIKLVSLTSALLVEEGCVPLVPPVPLAQSQFQIDPNNPAHLIYNSRDFYVELNVANRVGYGQSLITYAPTNGTTATANPLPQPSTAGNLVVCAINYNSPNGTAQINSVTDNLNNTYSRAVGPTSSARNMGLSGYTAEVWYAENIQGGAGLQTTANLSEAMNGPTGFQCSEYSGMETVNAFDQASTAFVTQPAASLTLPALNTNSSNQLLYVAHFGGADNTLGFNVRVAGGDGSEDRFLTEAGSYGVTVPTPNAAVGAMAVAITFRAK